MWTIIKFEQKNFNFLKNQFYSKLGKETEFYLPKIYIQKRKKNKILNKDINLLGDYLFCYNKNFCEQSTIQSLKFTKGLKYFLSGTQGSQREIFSFIKKCKSSENTNGYLSENFFDLNTSKNYKLSSGPFAEKIFKIIDFQKNKIKVLLGNIKTTISKKQLNIRPI